MSTQPNESRTLQAAFPQAGELNETHERLHLGWRILLTVLLLVAMVALGLWTTRSRAAAMPAAQSGASPLVLAFYYTWFDENTWTYDKLPDLPAQTYVSRDRGVMGRHIEQAQAAGIDAFLVAWYGPGGDTNQTEPNLAALLDEAAARNFKIGVLFETDSPFLGSPGAITGALQHIRDVHANHPAFLRVDGRPVVFFWRPHMYGVDTWRSVRSQVDAGYNMLWIAEGVDTSYLAIFDGHHLYSNTWNPPSNLGYTNQKFANWVATARDQFGAYKFWVATVMPGYNDVRIRPGNGFARDREGGGYYAASWQAAMASNPNWIVITSFNEWPEGTYIEPSAAYGDLYLQLTREWSSRFKTGGGDPAAVAAAAPAPLVAAAAADASPAVAAQVAAPQVDPDVPTALVTAALLNVRATPELDGEVIGMVAAGEGWPIVGRDGETPAWWQIEYGEQRGWVFADFVQTAGPVDEVGLTLSLGADAGDTVTLAAANTAVINSGATPVHDPTTVSLWPHLSRRP